MVKETVAGIVAVVFALGMTTAVYAQAPPAPKEDNKKPAETLEKKADKPAEKKPAAKKEAKAEKKVAEKAPAAAEKPAEAKK